MTDKLKELQEKMSIVTDKRIKECEKNRCPILKKEYERLYQKMYYLKNKEHIQATQREYRAQKRGDIAKYSNNYYHANKDTKVKEYREKNSEKLKLYRQEYYIKNKEAVLKRVKAYQQKIKNEK